MLEIIDVLPGSTAARLGLKTGDVVVSVNGKSIQDVIDFKFFSTEERLALVIQRRDGTRKTVRLRKQLDEGLGLEFAPLRITRCRNKCIFCFVDQMPPGCRKTLYVKDDDFRASFLYGNFITLGALSEADWERIFAQRLSPLYISVHTTDPDLRSVLLHNKRTPPIMSSLKRLADQGIRIHAQIVLCPGINDGDRLVRTLTDLAGLFPSVASIAVVPVGLTSFRKGLFLLRAFTSREARAVLAVIDMHALRFKKQFGTRLVFASDEFYIQAGTPIPPYAVYEDFPQLENGVGLVATFLREARRIKLLTKIEKITATVATGVSFSKILRQELPRLQRISGIHLKQVTVKNGFFGPSVTVAGLLTGRDILHALKGRRLGDMVLIPSAALKEGEALFLDGMSLEQLEHELGTPVVPVEGFKDIVRALKRGGKRVL